MKRLGIMIASTLLMSSCGATPPRESIPPADAPSGTMGPDQVTTGTRPREAPPRSGEPRDIAFPAVTRASLENGLETNTVEWHQLPILSLRLVIKSGGETDPQNKPGLSRLVAAMLKEGTRRTSSAELAEKVEFLGADLSVDGDEENVTIHISALNQHLDEALSIIADMAMNPAFREDELQKLKRRELDRLALQLKDPAYLTTRAFYKALYGEHPYAHIDTTPEVVRDLSRTELSRWHRRYFAPDNAFLVAAGDVTPQQLKQAAERAFGRWRRATVPEPQYAPPPSRSQREVVVVDRPDSVQSVIAIGNLAIERNNPEIEALLVANQVLGGSPASRLFMDLRERRSLTYGAYSRIGEMAKVAPFRARAAVRTQVTSQAMEAFFEHLSRIVTEAASAQELGDAKRYLIDSFPLDIDTPGKIAGLVAALRIFGLPDDYWDRYRSKIAAVEPEQALAAARRYIRPDQALVVVVGRAADIVEPLRAYGAVTVVDADGTVKQSYPAAERARSAPQ